MLLQMIAQNWWSIMLRGVCAILFGVLAWIWPGVTLGALVLLWGCYAFADGVLAFAGAFSGAAQRPWWVLAIVGIVSIGAAVAAFLYPGLTAVGLLYVIALWAIATGVLQIVAAIELRRAIDGEFWLMLAGAVSILFGVLLIARPAMGAIAVAWMIGTYAVAFGVLLVTLGLRLRGLSSQRAQPMGRNQ
jgi:uncharacterized membrane protein HdeD (DUF308 family)